mgnify:CR=1 FL=1
MSSKRKTPIPKFLVCSSHEEPDRNFIIHNEYPRFIVEVLNDFKDEDIDSIRSQGTFFTKVLMGKNNFDILLLIEYLDPIDITKNHNFNRLHDIMEEMSKWHTLEVDSLKTIFQ